MIKKKLNKNIFIVLSLIALIASTCIPIYNMLIKGVFNWHIRQPQFIEGGLEIIIFIIISYLVTLYNKNNFPKIILIFGMLYLSINGVIIPFISVYIYFEIITFIGMKLLGEDKGILKNFINGMSLWVFFAIFASLFNHGTINDLRIMTVVLLLLSLLRKGDQNYNTIGANLFNKIDEISSDKYSVGIFIILTFFILSLLAKTNSAIDYDSIWYGLRPEHVLVGENSFYDYLGYSCFVYYYPKLMELFYLPISGLGDYSFIITANIFILILFMKSFYELLSILFKKHKSEIFKLSFTLATFSIPAICNISATAKPDIMGAFFTFLAFSFFLQYVNNKNTDNIFYILISIVMLTGTKQTYLLWGGLLFLIIVVSFFFIIKPNKEEMENIFNVKTNLKSILLLIITCVSLLGVHYRTLKLTGYPLYPILISTFNKIGFYAHYPFKVKSVPIVPEIQSVREIIYRLYQYIFNPNDLAKVIMLWTSSFIFYLLLLIILKWIFKICNYNYKSYIIINKSTNIEKIFYLILFFFSFITIYYMVSLASPDGNYFIIPIVFFIFILMYIILEQQDFFLFDNIIKYIFLFFIILHLTISFVSHPSWSVGTKSFSSEIIVNNFETVDNNNAILKYYGIINIAEHLEQEFYNRRVISSAQELTIINRIDAPIETFHEIESEHLSNKKISSTYEEFHQYVNYANIEGFVLLNEDKSLFRDYVEQYTIENGYSYTIEDEKAIFYCIKRDEK